jgi:hypothetical protein
MIITNVGEAMDHLELPFVVSESVKLYSHFRK